MFEVIRKLTFCYGHRLMNYDGKCKVPHGHNGSAEIVVAGAALDGRGMVVDFGELKRRVAEWIDRELDHKMLFRRDDPLVPVFRKLAEPFYLMDENPTAENIAKLLFEQVRAFGFNVVEVRLCESETSCAVYRQDTFPGR
jgi:6-pyruvoyltetrahydropterin/6-carboxytetrahydropterin synthase